VLERVAGLTGARNEVQYAVERVLIARQPDADPMTKGEALSLLDEATTRWLSQSQLVERELLQLASTDEPELDADVSTAADAIERVWGISLIHLAVCADLAKLGPLDFLENDDDQISAAVSLPASTPPSAIAAVAGDGFQDGQIGRALTMSAQQADEHDDAGPDAPPRKPPTYAVLAELVHRASESTCKVLVGTVPIPAAHVIFDNITPLLKSAIGAAPDGIASAAQKIVKTVARLALLVLRRVRDVMNAVRPGAFDFLKEQLLEEAQDEGSKHILSPVVRPIVAKILAEQGCFATIRQKRLYRGKTGEPEPDNEAALRKILKHNTRWVARPVPIAASTVLRPLWHLSWAGVPAAPIAACLLLAWTILLTGDELDIPGWPFPNFYRPGLLTIA
jgi:hypothetical protein